MLYLLTIIFTYCTFCEFTFYGVVPQANFNVHHETLCRKSLTYFSLFQMRNRYYQIVSIYYIKLVLILLNQLVLMVSSHLLLSQVKAANKLLKTIPQNGERRKVDGVPVFGAQNLDIAIATTDGIKWCVLQFSLLSIKRVFYNFIA